MIADLPIAISQYSVVTNFYVQTGKLKTPTRLEAPALYFDLHTCVSLCATSPAYLIRAPSYYQYHHVSASLLIVALAPCCFSVFARPDFPNRIPNGRNVPGCEHLGHEGCVSGAARNQFGVDFEAAGFAWTPEFCGKDSDGDGVTNGEELGDPCCTWTQANGGGKGFRSSGLSHPGEKSKDDAKTQPKCDQSDTSSAAATSTSTGAATTTTKTSPAATTAGGATTAASDDDNNVCFPASAIVELSSGAFLPMSSLSIGDVVRVGPGPNDFSPVFMFTHKLAGTTNRFVTLKTADGHAITLTPSHFIYSNDALIPASAVAPGATLSLASGHVSTVTSVSESTAAGLYNPQTAHGDIVVNGIIASTYTTAITPTFAHAALAPFRAFLAPGASVSTVSSYFSVFDSGVDKSSFGSALLRLFRVPAPAESIQI